jgi:hypothetical protein
MTVVLDHEKRFACIMHRSSLPPISVSCTYPKSTQKLKKRRKIESLRETDRQGQTDCALKPPGPVVPKASVLHFGSVRSVFVFDGAQQDPCYGTIGGIPSDGLEAFYLQFMLTFGPIPPVGCYFKGHAQLPSSYCCSGFGDGSV